MQRREHGYKFLALELTADGLAVTGGLLGAYFVRFHSGLIPVTKSYDPQGYFLLLPIAWLLWIVSLRLTHCYQNHPLVLTFNTARRLLKGSLLAVALIVAFEHFTRLSEYSRIMYPLTLGCVLGGLLLCRALLQQIIKALIRDGVARSRVLIVGTGPLARRLAQRCQLHPEYGYEPIGFVSDRSEHTGRVIDGLEVVGSVERLADLIQRHRSHEVFVTQSNLHPEEYLRLWLESEREIARIRIVPNMVEMMTGGVYYDEVAGIPLLTLKETPLTAWNAFFKRWIDILGSALALLLLAPFYPLVAWLIRRESPGPALYRQKRTGIDGTEFEIVKLRTMPVNAESSGPVWGERIDSRSTRIGRLLRRWDLDELPQLWNVLRGDMSLVGPRPERPQFVAEFKQAYPRYMGRLRVRAGLTGWAQVHGLRGNTPIDHRIQYDLYYIENWSFWLDLKILLMTFFSRHEEAPEAVAEAAPVRSASEGAEARVPGARPEPTSGK